MAKKKNKQTKAYKKFAILISLLMVASIGYLGCKIYNMGLISNQKYFTVAIIAGVLVLLLSILNISSKKGFMRFITTILVLVLFSSSLYLSYNINITEKLIDQTSKIITKKEVYNIYVLADSNLKTVDDLKNKNIGIFNNESDSLLKAVANLKNKVGHLGKEIYFDDLDNILSDGVSKKIDAILITSTLDDILDEQYKELKEKYRLLGTISVKELEKVKKNEKDITKDSFIIYISGIDTYGNIGTVSRSDVNILVAVNPKTHKILLVNTPRDYYVKLHSKNAYDKLTHAGIYGVDESIHTLEDLYGVDIPYYVKVNFSSLIKIIDALGGVEVNSKYSFSYDGYSFRKGRNTLNGKSALAFSRFRKGLPEGDISRGENQEEVIKAIVSKATSASILTNYSSILNSLSKSFVTNISTDDIYKLVKYQMDNQINWDISNANVLGINAYDVTYSTGKTKLYVMKQDESSIMSVKTSLKSILEN